MPKIRIKLSQDGIQQAREELNQISDWLKTKARELAEELAKAGVQTAQANTGQYSEYIWFETTTEDTLNGAIVTISMRDRQKIIRKWYYRKGVKQAVVSPSLMAEFGSGRFAVSGEIKGLKLGRGTFPEQKHAWDDVWHWTTLDGVRHTSSGESPTRPMFTAYTRLKDQDLIRSIAERVFV